MAWYNDPGRTTYVATYKDEKELRREVEMAAKYGWSPQNTTGISGHINVGRTVAPALMTGGLSLLFGASRSKDKITVTYSRETRFVANEQLQMANSAVGQQTNALNSATHAANASRLALENTVSTNGRAESKRESAEKDVRNVLKQTDDCQKAALRSYSNLSATVSHLQSAYTYADNEGVIPTGARIDVRKAVGDLSTVIETETERGKLLTQLRTLQDPLVEAAKNCDRASENRTKADSHLAQARGKQLEIETKLSEAQGNDAEKLSKKRVEAQGDVSKQEEEVQKWSAEEDRFSTILNDLRSRRDQFMPQVLGTSHDVSLPPVATATPVAAPTTQPPPQPTAVSLAADGNGEILAQLQKLGELHSSGVLTDDEFASKKAELLARL